MTIPRALLLLAALAVSLDISSGEPPNVIFITMSGGGWYDFHEDPDMPLGNITALKNDGVFLDQSYVFPWSVVTKAAFMAGRYPHTFGLQSPTLAVRMVHWINATFTFLPREFKKLKYTTHMVGKWNLGFCHPALTPEGRGFDTFYGSYAGIHDSNFYHRKAAGGDVFYDWMDGDSLDLSANGTYETDLFTARAVDIINGMDNGRQHFLYLTYREPAKPMETPDHYKNQYCSHITNDQRKIVCAKIAALDTGVGAVVQALKDKNLYDNTVILFMSDSGGEVNTGVRNYPLRGAKEGIFEGGILSYTILKGNSAWASRQGQTWSGLALAIDWFPTLLRAAGGSRPDYVHGLDLYESIKDNGESPREHFIMVTDHFKYNYTLVRRGPWKLMRQILNGTSFWTPGRFNLLYPPLSDNASVPEMDSYEKLASSEYLLFNVKKDPQERNGTVTQEKGKVESLNKLLKREMKNFPLQPLPRPDLINKTTNFQKDGLLALCWCQPKGADASACNAP